MLRVALTGNIASGKSAVADEWREAGAPIVDADMLAREAVAPGTPGLAAVAAAFGPDVIGVDGMLDRGRLRALVFAEETARARLESIVHPEVERLRTAREAVLAAAGEKVIVHVIPLLFEVGLEDRFDEVVLVDAPERVRLARLVQRRGLDAGEAARMIGAQAPAAAKRLRATRIIDNAGSLDELRAEARRVWHELKERAIGCA